MKMLSFLQRKKDISGLSNHSFFSTVDSYILFDIENLKIDNALKKRVVVVFMTTQFKHIKQVGLKLVNNPELLLDGKLEVSIINAIKQAETDCLYQGVPQIFINKYNGWNEEHIRVIISSTRKICNSSMTDTDMKVRSILDTLQYSLHMTITDAELTINELNGELAKLLKGTIYDY